MVMNRAVVAICAAQGCAQISAFSVAALIPTLISVWGLSNTEAGWISGIYYAAYARRPVARLADRSDRSQTRVPRLGRGDGAGVCRVRVDRRRILVGARLPRVD